CRAAYALLSKCAWGSSADNQFSDIVVKACAGAFLNTLSPAGKGNYAAESELCDYEHQRQEGTMYLSQAALCRAEVALRFAGDPRLADRPLPAASFDCAKARTPLEKTICADPKLGRADVMLSRVYRQAMQSLTPDEQRALNADERKWMAKVAADCRLTDAAASAHARDCAREAFERRFTAIDGCEGDGDVAKCANAPD
ncbi:MAG: lysozyme inhibitor LprI family protein, partial [Roseiarcus sp.]